MEIRNEKVKIKSHILVRAANNKPLIINSMIYGATRYLWLATNKGIYIYNISSKSFSKVPASNNDISVGKIMLDNNGILWAGRKDGVFRLEEWNQAGLLPVFKKVQLPEAITQVESLFQDRRGSIWVGTLKNGVFRLTMPFSALNNGPQWKAEHVIKQINNTSFIGSIINIKCFFEDKYGVLWIGTAGGGAIYTNLKTPKNVWDASGKNATYKDRPDKSKPFFAVFNTGITHMSRVATRTTEGRSSRSAPMDKVIVPPYIPDLPEVRDDISWNMDAVKRMDAWVGQQLKELEQSGEADNTIIFFYADHGGTVPRGKAYVYETGTLVPFIVYFPPRWKHLAGTTIPSVSDRLVSFVDLAPTVLSLCNVSIPDFMVGAPFLGKAANDAQNLRQYIFTFRANQGDTYAPSRAITDGRYKLIWNYQSAYPNGTRQDYQWQMPAQQAWDKAFMAGTIKNPLHLKFCEPVETFELYDIQKDSLETTNLASLPAYKDALNTLKKALQSMLREQKDLGFIPREYRRVLQKEGALYDVVRKAKIDVSKEISAAEIASLKDPKQLATLLQFLSDKDPVVQYWGASGICGLAKIGLIKNVPKAATNVLQDTSVIPEVKCMLAEAMVYAGDTQRGLDYLLQQLKDGFGPAAACLQNVGVKATPLVKELQQLLTLKSQPPKLKFYIRSILINCGVLPYDRLYDANEKVES
ncbi:sulfatase-like hydrolase/transferase [Mycovorax composti]